MKNLKPFIILLTLISTHINLIAQNAKVIDLSKRLYVGEQFTPPSSIKLMRGMENKINWKALYDKVVLIDLFETSCGSCIQIMPHLQELEKKHGNIFKVIIVTPEDKKTMTDFFHKNEYLKEHKVNLPVIYQDDYFRKMFPYKSIPQAILLYQGKVQAITSSGFITSDNILKLHQQGSIDLPLKDDFGKGNLLAASGSVTEILKAGVFFSGYQSDVNYQPWKFETDSVTGLYRSSIFNSGIYSALKSLMANAKLLDKYFVPRMDRVVWKVKDSTIYENFSANPKEVWLVDNGISYERYDRIKRPDSIQALEIMYDFESIYGVKIYLDKKLMPCLVLKSCVAVPSKEKKEGQMVYVGSKVFATFLDYVNQFPPVIDEVNIDTRIEVGNVKTLEELNKQLVVYGIRGEIEERKIDVLVVEEVNL
ncbi:TlpA family protein disulfide reductase [Sphingobacterium tabacisoli]|uniref:Redoxin domain-containing protein n=1 Tax=Sphingobacterium tabacisoli TaxID=2044855 RepID=A0ABW5KVU2_9SPHI|nr:redoxin domain-containing protein [Sphingobacterium tabacisoli]